MKKRILALMFSLVLLLVMTCPCLAADEDVPFNVMVLDDSGVLLQSEVNELSDRAWEITQMYGCAVYIVTVDSLDGMDVWAFAESVYEQLGMGYGSEQSGVMLLLSMEEREYDIMAHGYGNTVFTDYGKQEMAEQFLDEFAEDDWYNGFVSYLDSCEAYLQSAQEEPAAEQGRSPVMGIVLAVVPSVLIAFIVCSSFKAQMKTARTQHNAQGYIDEQGLVLTMQNDQFLHTTHTRRKIESNNGGTTVNSRGSSHRSGKF